MHSEKLTRRPIRPNAPAACSSPPPVPRRQPGRQEETPQLDSQCLAEVHGSGLRLEVSMKMQTLGSDLSTDLYKLLTLARSAREVLTLACTLSRAAALASASAISQVDAFPTFKSVLSDGYANNILWGHRTRNLLIHSSPTRRTLPGPRVRRVRRFGPAPTWRSTNSPAARSLR